MERIDILFIRRAFAESGLSKVELARRSGLTREHVTNILNGNLKNAKNGCGVDTLVAILEACGFELRMGRKLDGEKFTQGQ